MQFSGSENLLEFQLISKSVPLLTTVELFRRCKGQTGVPFGTCRRFSASRKKKVRINFPSGLIPPSLGEGVRRLLWSCAGSRKLSFDKGNG